MSTLWATVVSIMAGLTACRVSTLALAILALHYAGIITPAV